MYAQRLNIDSTPYHIYYDTSITNNDITGNQLLRLSFSETRSGGSLISNPSEYFFSIVRFEVQTLSLPLFIPQIMLGQGNIHKTVYHLEVFDSNGHSWGDYLQYTPSNLSMTPPSLPLTDDSLIHPYYHIHNLNDWVDMVNTNLQTILKRNPHHLTILNAAYNFVYDISSGLITLEIPVLEGYDTLQIAFNGALNTILNGFCVNKINHDESGYILRLPDRVNNKRTDTISGQSCVIYSNTQNYPSLSLCTPIESIVFTSTGNLPVVPSNSGPLKVHNNYNTASGTQSGINSVSSALVPILTDLIVPLDKGWEYKPYILYNPSVYRLMDMNSNNSINNIDIQVFWKSNLTGALVPIYLDSQCSASMKIMFRRKHFDDSI
jgi:hypothetical protein